MKGNGIGYKEISFSTSMPHIIALRQHQPVFEMYPQVFDRNLSPAYSSQSADLNWFFHVWHFISGKNKARDTSSIAMRNLLILTPVFWLFFLTLATCASAADMQVQAWGNTKEGTHVEETCISNNALMQVCYIDYGATITSITVPDRQGKMENIVLSLPDLASYQKTRHRHAAVIGRYAAADSSCPIHTERQSYLANAKPAWAGRSWRPGWL
ncbi:hypothetical protein [Undibacterium sp. TJN19]|uniref:aldose epimerase family protein n=1 Tax=Undibacterium sp. TJN19 TaxID=3413055 RepID=UPI003BF40188